MPNVDEWFYGAFIEILPILNFRQLCSLKIMSKYNSNL